MNIKKAKTENFEDVKLITHETIKEIYPHYYPRGVVDFFLNIIIAKTLQRIF